MPEQASKLPTELFSLERQIAVVTGGTGVLGGAMGRGLARAGAKVGVLGRRRERAEAAVRHREGRRRRAGVARRRARPRRARSRTRGVLEQWGRLDMLVNAAGGNMPSATLEPGQSCFNLPVEGMEPVMGLNLEGTLLPTQVFGETMSRAGRGCIVNVSSMAAQRAMTRVLGYGAAKARVENATRWLAAELARSFGEGLRVNAIAPDFFVGEQNRTLLLNEDGTLTSRGQPIIDHTPAGRFREPDYLIGPLIWLCGPGASFGNGIVVPVDGGFGAFSGV
jgi:NAD(P)-dependent dehydrogenase (short-subunit alcohol dehydrogenase family)